MVRALALALLLSASPASARAPAPCVSSADAEALALVALPEIIRQTGAVCSTRLPATSLIRRDRSGLLAKYDAAADRAWPAASAAVVRLSDPAMEMLVSSQYARPLLTTLIATQIVGRIAPADCGMIDRLVTLLQPLPPANTAGVIVTMLQYLKSEKAKGATVAIPDLPICTGPVR